MALASHTLVVCCKGNTETPSNMVLNIATHSCHMYMHRPGNCFRTNHASTKKNAVLRANNS